MLKGICFLYLYLNVVLGAEEETKQPRICVIGAGVSGLSVTYNLQKTGINDIDVFEKSDDVGGTWRYNPNVGKDGNGLPIHTSMYKSLRTNLPRHTMEFPDFRMPANVSSFPSGNCFYKYIQKFADKFELRKYIKFRNEVKAVTRANDIWKVEYRQLNDSKINIREYDYIMVCNGHNFKPNWPNNIEGAHKNFSGLIMHSHDYREPSTFKDKKVLVVGAGPSGLDIGVDIAYVATKVILSHHYKEFKSPFPENFIQKPDIKLIQNDSVVFTDDTSEDVDIILYCTGYEYSFPFLDESAGLRLPGSYVAPLYRNTVNINQPTMLFFGLGVYGVVTFSIHTQAQYAASLVTGNFTLPPKEVMMKDWEAKVEEVKAAGKRMKHIHYLSPTEVCMARINLKMQFYDGMTAEAGMPKVPRVMVWMGQVATAAKYKNWYNFRNEHYTIKNDTIFTVEYRPGEEICDLE